MKTTKKQTKTKPETVTIEIPKDVFDSFNAFVRIAGISHTTQDIIIEDMKGQVRQSVECSRPSSLGGICEWLLEGYTYESEEEKELVKHQLFAEACRQRPEADILPFHQSPRELVME